MIKSNYLIHDCETGGLDPEKNPITQYACVVLDGVTLKEIDRYETFVKPYNNLKIEQKALDSTMVTMSDVNRGVTVKEFTKTVVELWKQNQVKSRIADMGRLISVGHNVPFDHSFINYALLFCGYENGMLDWFFPNFIDTFALGKMLWGVNREEKLNLGACCERAKIKLTDAHGAMNDVEATADLFRWFIKRMRANKGVSVGEDGGRRARGAEFFEFKCGAK